MKISKLIKNLDEEFENMQRKMEGVAYKVGVGSLMYAKVDTKIDLAFAVSMVSQFVSKASLPN